jgi:hypothetical protein
MKKIVYIIIIFLIVSCKNETKNKSFEVYDIEPVGIEDYDDSFEFSIIKSFNYEKLINLKLQDYFDLKVLEQQHPEFKDAIKKQLYALSNDDIDVSNFSTKITIENIRQIGKPIIVSDSVQKLKLHFDIVTEQNKTTDSIIATIINKSVVIDNEKRLSTKIIFSKALN